MAEKSIKKSEAKKPKAAKNVVEGSTKPVKKPKKKYE